MWIISYAVPSFVTMINVYKGVTLFVYLNAFFSTIIQFFIGSSFYKHAYKGLKRKAANMEVLVMLGTTAAWGYGFALLFIGYSDMIMEDE